MIRGFRSTLRACLFVILLGSGLALAETGLDTLFLVPGRTVYPLSHSFFHIDSIIPAPAYRYFPDALNGRLVFVTVPDSPDTLAIHYRYNSLSAPRRDDLGVRRIDSWFPEEKAPVNTSAAASNVATSGSISRKLQVSSSGQSTLSGGIDIRLSGEVAPGVSLQGIISDNNAPFEEYSSTQSVQEVDKILIQLRSDKFNVDMGDVYVQKKWDHWTRIDRKLIGADAAVSLENMNSEVFFGGSEGQFIRQEISGRDGDQGPYRLYGDNEQEAITIVPGTETVYLDGERLDKKDYTLYYSEAEIFFSQGHILSSASRVVVEFNYKNEFYPATSAGFHTSWKLGEYFKAGASYLREKDDENNPGDVNLSGISPDSLASMTVSDGSVIISSALEDTAGAYVAAGDIWLYVGPSLGTHTVYFYRENTNGGYVRAYTDDGTMYYVYDPENTLSQYYPRRIVGLPETRELLSVDISAKNADKYDLGAEAAYSSYRPNNYNSDEKLQAAALRWQAEAAVSKQVYVGSDGWYRGADFTSFGTLTAPEFERGLGYSSQDTLLMYGDIFARHKHEKSTTQGGFQLAEDVNGEKRRRIYGDHSSSGEAFSLDAGAYTLADDLGVLPYFHSDASFSYRLLKNDALKLSFLQDHFTPLNDGMSGSRTEKISAAWSRDAGQQLAYTFKKDYDWNGTDSTFETYSRKHDVQTSFRKGFWEKKLDVNLSATYRMDRRDSGNEQYFLTRGRVSARIPKWNLRAGGLADVNRTSETKREAVFIRVGDGLGYYSLDEYGQYVPDEMGDYILQYEQTNERLDQYVSKLGSNLNWDAKLGNMRLNAVHTGNTEFRTPGLVLYKKISLTDPDTTCYYGYVRLRNELSLTDADKKQTVTVYFNDKSSQNLQTSYNEQVNRNNERRVSYRRNMENGKAELYYKYELSQQERLPQGTYSIQTDRHRIGLESQWSKTRSIRLKGDVFYTRVAARFNGDSYTADWLEFSQDLTWYRVADERIFLSLTLDRIVTDYESSLPYETAQGLPAGWSVLGSLRYERKISRFVSASAYLQYRKRGEADDVLTANMEVKAYF